MAILESLGTAVPGPPVPQAAVRRVAEEILAVLSPDLVEKMAVFDTVGIRKRHFVRPVTWYLEPRGWRERSAAFLEEGVVLLEKAAREALRSAGVAPEQVDGVVLVCTTGISTPSLEARLANRMGLRPDVIRVPVFGLGCAGGVSGLNLAADLARAHPDKRFLLLALETCSLSFNLNDLSVRAFVATTLFADGAAAALVRGREVEGRSLGRLRRGLSHQWPQTEHVMGWEVMDEGLRVVFDRSIPELVAKELPPVVSRYLAREGVTPDRYALHPGGTKVLQAYEASLDVAPEALKTAWHVLSEYGNMSSPTVLFVLQEALEKPLAPGETALLAALGPGFSAELGLLEG